MYACNVYDVTDDFTVTVRQETLDNVRRIRHHLRPPGRRVRPRARPPLHTGPLLGAHGPLHQHRPPRGQRGGALRLRLLLPGQPLAVDRMRALRRHTGGRARTGYTLQTAAYRNRLRNAQRTGEPESGPLRHRRPAFILVLCG